MNVLLTVMKYSSDTPSSRLERISCILSREICIALRRERYFGSS